MSALVTKRAWIGVAAAALCMLACSARRSEPVSGPLPVLNAEQHRGQVLFMHTCNPCHPQGEAGLGGSINGKEFLPNVAIKAKIRTGLGGNMPTFSSDQLSDDDIDQIVEYIKVLRSQKKRTDVATE